MRARRAFGLLILGLSLLLPATAHAGGPHMLVGSVDDGAARPTLVQTKAELDLARVAGLSDAIRVSLTWVRGRTAPGQAAITGLRNVVDAASLDGTAVYIQAYPSGSAQTPLTAPDQRDFVAWLTAIARSVPGARHFIVGNEPNLNGFWLPQFGPSGEDLAATSYVSLLAGSYDALKGVSPAIEVIGGALSHAGIDRPGTKRDTHSPTQFILDMGATYRASGRDRPLMDAFAFHPYLLDSNQAPTLQHPSSTTITIADYGKLVTLLGQAFDGTAQKGSNLPIVYDEFGVQSITPAGKAPLYTGTEARTVHPVDEATQASYYVQALRLAFCQPTVKTFLLFPLVDERNLAGWQSGVYYVDETPKQSLPIVAAAAARVRRNAIAVCPGLAVTPRPKIVFFPNGPPGPAPGRIPVVVTCDVDCLYVLRLERLPSHSTTLRRSGHAIGSIGTRIVFPRTRLAPGSYRFTIRVDAVLNRGPSFVRASRAFIVD